MHVVYRYIVKPFTIYSLKLQWEREIRDDVS